MNAPFFLNATRRKKIQMTPRWIVFFIGTAKHSDMIMCHLQGEKATTSLHPKKFSSQTARKHRNTFRR